MKNKYWRLHQTMRGPTTTIQPERFVDYDSEENEVEVVMNKKDRVKKAGELFEQEADLSGS